MNERETGAKSPRGILLSIEGIDGAGKSTITAFLAQKLEQRGYSVRVVREPGGTRIGEQIRQILLDPANKQLSAQSEALLYVAARAQLVQEILRPSLNEGQVVLCDRFFDSTFAYQGGGRSLNPSDLQTLNQIATGGLVPDFTFLLDVDPQEGFQRKREQSILKPVDRLEAESLSFYRRVREAYITVAQENPQRIQIINASNELKKVQEAVWERVREVLI